MTSKIRIRLGEIEIEYEGDESFLTKELPQLLAVISELHVKSGATNSSGSGSESGTNGAGNAEIPELTTGSIAAKLSAKSGTDLILAASAHLTFVAKKQKFSRQEIINEMKSALAYFKKSYVSNLSKGLNALVKSGKLLEPSSDAFAMSATTQASLKARLA